MGLYWVSFEQYLLILGSTGSVLGGTDWYWLVLGATGSEQGSTGCQCDMLSENIWFTWCKPSNYSIFGEGKGDDGQTNGQTDRQNFLSKNRPLLCKGSSKNHLYVERHLQNWVLVVYPIDCIAWYQRKPSLFYLCTN